MRLSVVLFGMTAATSWFDDVVHMLDSRDGVDARIDQIEQVVDMDGSPLLFNDEFCDSDTNPDQWFMDAAPLGVLSLDEFLDAVQDIFNSPMKSAYTLSGSPDFFDERIATTLEKIDLVYEALDPAVDRGIVAGIRQALEDHIVAFYQNMKQECIQYHEKHSVGQL